SAGWVAAGGRRAVTPPAVWPIPPTHALPTRADLAAFGLRLRPRAARRALSKPVGARRRAVSRLRRRLRRAGLRPVGRRERAAGRRRRAEDLLPRQRSGAHHRRRQTAPRLPRAT